MNYHQAQAAIIAQRIRLLSRFVLLATILVIARLFYLQINLQHYLADRGQKNFLRIETINSPRGNILDRTGMLLATNRPVTTISWVGSGRRTLTDEQRLALKKLGAILGKALDEDSELMAKLKTAERRYKEIPLADDVAFDTLGKVAE